MSVGYRLLYGIGFTPWEENAELPGLTEPVGALLDREEARRQPPFGPALDLGRGSGLWAVELAARGWQVAGIDNVPKALRRARERARETGVELRLIEGDVTKLRGTGVGSGFPLLLDLGLFHDELTDRQRAAMGREVSAVASPGATLLMVAWAPGRRGPLPHGASRADIEAAYPEWEITHEAALDQSGSRCFRRVKNADPRLYRLRHEWPSLAASVLDRFTFPPWSTPTLARSPGERRLALSWMATRASACAIGILVLGALAAPAAAGNGDRTVRFATFNASVNRNTEGELLSELSDGEDPQLRNVAEIIQRARPDVLLINEFDFVPDDRAVRLFQRNYLSVSQHGARPIWFPFRFTAPSNTGIASGKDLDNNGQIVTQPGSGLYGNDAFGFGEFPGKFGMAVYSRLPIDRKRVRTFQHFRWADMPGALLPDDPSTPAPSDWYSADELDIFRLSSKSHWDLPIQVGHGQRVHFLVSHPTPPVFDGPEDRNGTRNHDEIRLWADYINLGAGRYIYDDRGVRGGLRWGEHFVIAGDQNADPFDGDSTEDAIQQLLDSPFINTRVTPRGPGGPEQSALQGGINDSHLGDPAFDTADFADGAPGNLRADYVLPSRSLRITNAFVFWPPSDDPLFPLVGTFDPTLLRNGNGFPSSDHRLVAIDVEIPRHPHNDSDREDDDD